MKSIKLQHIELFCQAIDCMREQIDFATGADGNLELPEFADALCLLMRGLDRVLANYAGETQSRASDPLLGHALQRA